MAIRDKFVRWDHATEADRRERVAELIRVLEGVRKRRGRRTRFNMNTWGHREFCRTTACAAGYAALDPWFAERGFSVRWQPAAAGLRGLFKYGLDFTELEPAFVFGAEIYYWVFHAIDLDLDQVLAKLRSRAWWAIPPAVELDDGQPRS